MERKKIAVIGAGSWGTAIAVWLSRQGYGVCLWCFEKNLVKIMKEKRINTFYLNGISLSEKIKFTNSLEEAVCGADIIFSVVPSQYVREITSLYSSFVSEDAIIISATKGIEYRDDIYLDENDVFLRMSQVISDRIVPPAKVLALSGPTFAIEVAKGLPTSAVIAGKDLDTIKYIQKLFSSPVFRLYYSTDIVGVELGGALKNIIAIAAGISDGLDFGNNTRVALIVRGLCEITRLGMWWRGVNVADRQTFLGLSGMGDLILTATSDKSRNYDLGFRIGKGEKLADILNGMRVAVEGVETTRIALLAAKEKNIEVPITEKLAEILFENKNPREAVEELMTRKLRGE